MKKKTAIITAASKGIGAACAKVFAEKGYNVSIMARNEDVFTLAKSINALATLGDVAQDSDLKKLVDHTIKEYKTIDVVISNTGHPPKGELLDLTDEQWITGLELCLLNVVRIARYAVPFMQIQGSGNFVNISSFGAVEPNLGFPISSAMRSALSSFTKQFSMQYALDHIRMNSVLPGYVDTYPLSELGKTDIPMKRQAKPEEIANTVYFLASEESSYINGQNILVDGGLVKSL